MTVPSAAAWIGVPHAAARSMPVWNIGRPSSGWMRGPKGEVSPPGTGWMKQRRGPMIGAAMASAVAGARLIDGNMNRPPPMAAENAESPRPRAASATSATACVRRQLCAGRPDGIDGVLHRGGGAGGQHDRGGRGRGVLPPRKGSSANSTSMRREGHEPAPHPDVQDARTAALSASVTVTSAPLEPLLLSPSTSSGEGVPTPEPEPTRTSDGPVATTIGRRVARRVVPAKPGRYVAAILRKPRHLGTSDLAVRGALLSVQGEEDRPNRGGQGRSRTGRGVTGA